MQVSLGNQGKKQASCIILCLYMAISKQISPEDSLLERPQAWLLSLALSRVGFGSTAIPGLPRYSRVLPATLRWTVGHSRAREGHRLVN